MVCLNKISFATHPRMDGLLIASLCVFILGMHVGHATPLAPKLLKDESYGESFTAVADLKDGTYVLTQFVFTNAGFGDGKAACRALVVTPGSSGINDAVRYKRKEWRYIRDGNLLQVGWLHFGGTGHHILFQDTILWMGNGIGPLPIVGHKEQTRGGNIQPSHGEQPGR